ncbi:SGNH/GDSL hydrolase family protein [Actinoplanes sp. NPDC049265]|uniref:SGNH/GDSL hydrolase family protein n=1 Tax=Actinoplanes sp. NPDC049265 TaxID=3363902 RepID=UPI003710673C
MRTLISLAAIASAVLIPLSTMSAPAQAAAPQQYVALGDSYASGVGAYPYDDATCLRSPRSYPRTWAAAHPSYTLTDRTCSGATIADVRNTQLSALNATTALVTIQVGGNDDGFRSTVENCLTGSDSLCSVSSQLGSHYATHDLVDNLAALYADVQARAPHAAIAVLGYPRLVTATGSCGLVNPSAAKRTALNSNADAMAQGVKAAADRRGLYFIDVRSLFQGHEACGTAPWINGVDLAHQTEIFHPTAAGHKAYADILTIATDW